MEDGEGKAGRQPGTGPMNDSQETKRSTSVEARQKKKKHLIDRSEKVS